MGNFITVDPTRIYAAISEHYAWNSNTSAYCVCVPVTVGKRYWLSLSESNSSTVGTIFRWGCTNSSTPSGQTLSRCVRATPQSCTFAEVVPDAQYLILQFAAAYAESVVNSYLSVYECSDSETEDGEILTRRREIMCHAKPYWDYVWDYTMGKLEEQPGWALDGSGTSSIIGDGEKISTTSSYFQPYMKSNGIYSNLRYMPNGYGTMEVICYGVWNNSGNAKNLRITLGESSSNRVTLFPYNGKWRLLKNSTSSNSANTAIADAANNTLYTIRIVLKGTSHDIYINGTKVQSNITGTGFYAGGSAGVMHQNGGSSSYYAVVRSLKIHAGSD